MSARPTPALIGGFVVGALALVVLGIIVFGKGNFFGLKQDFRLYFSEDVNGLNVGAPVKFKGVTVGSVKSLSIVETSIDPPVEVIAQLDQRLIGSRAGASAADMRANMNVAINQGMRAQLQTESLVTGVQYIHLTFDRAPAKYFDPDAFDPDVPEIPTIPSSGEELRLTLSELVKKLAAADIDGLVASLVKTSDSIRSVTDSPTIRDAFKNLDGLLMDIRQAVTRLDPTLRSIQGAADGTTRLVSDLQPTVQELTETLSALKDGIGTIDRDLQPIMESVRGAAAAIEGTLNAVREQLAPDSPVAYEARRMLQQLAETLHSLELMLDLLERDPGALLRGRDLEGG